MSDAIRIVGVSARGFHGVYPEEKQNGQNFLVDATLYLDLSIAGKSDELTATVDYSQVAKYIETQITTGSYDLIERLAEVIAAGILAQYPLVERVEVTVHKPEADLGVNFSDLAVVISRSR